MFHMTKSEKPTEMLSAEHQNILKLISALESECSALESGKSIDREFFTKSIDFIRNYADKFHHAKEEDILFVELCSDSVSMHCNPTEQMRHEHEIGRGFVKGMEDALNSGSKQKLIENAKGYAQLLQEHIYKEDNILYPMADEALNPKMQQGILEKFAQAEKKRFAKGVKEKYIALAKEFGKRAK